MATFADFRFQGVFRDYQQQVLDDLEAHRKDRKIHIVAAPGSGKTVLGLELIRRLGTPALVLSPTVIIQRQWGQRLRELFDGPTIDTCVSEDLYRPALLTSITYQGLYAAWNRLSVAADTEQDLPAVDYRNIDLIAGLRAAGIRTICLDEAHHLKAAWQSALNSFVRAVEKEMTVISLTATPPYDSTPAEWGRYRSLCGEIDEEIPVPPLVWQGVLCPHQDFILFNFPAEDEAEAVHAFRGRAERCVRHIFTSGLFNDLLDAGGVLSPSSEKERWRWENTRGVAALLCMAQMRNIAVPREITRSMFPHGRIPHYTIEHARCALQFVLDNPTVFGEPFTKALHRELAGAGLLVRRRVCMESDDRLERQLITSRGKLDSIARIVVAEQANLGNRLRMLILTDCIDRELLPVIGTEQPLSQLGAVSVFEQVRRAASGAQLAVLTGSLLILPDTVLPRVQATAAQRNVSFAARPITASYSEVLLGGSSRTKVEMVTVLFGDGLLHIVVGTRSLLGEGWDAPCINSLILASFVGSFVLSNQMRGRAIRSDASQPDKVANIWHLVTVPPPANGSDSCRGDDFALMTRRFDCFLGPAYHNRSIESGVHRLGLNGVDIDASRVEAINRQMLEDAAARALTREKWSTPTVGDGRYRLLDVAEVPYRAAPPRFLTRNLLHLSALSAALCAVFAVLAELPYLAGSLPGYLVTCAVCLALMCWLLCASFAVLRILSPRRYLDHLARALLKTLCELGEIDASNAGVHIAGDAFGIGVEIGLAGGSLREKKLFCKAVTELFSPFDSPRYLLYRKRRWFWTWRPDYTRCYACPAIIAGHRKRVDVFARYLHHHVTPFAPVYTATAPGRDMLLRALRHAYINRNGDYIRSKRVVAHGQSAQKAALHLSRMISDTGRRYLWGIAERLLGR